MLLNNTTNEEVTFGIGTGQGRDVNFNVNPRKITEASLKQFRGPFQVSIKVGKTDELFVNQVFKNDCVNVCQGQRGFRAIVTRFAEDI